MSVGEVYAWDGTLVEVLTAHTTQSDWTPNLVPALFKIQVSPAFTDPVAGCHSGEVVAAG